MRKIKMYDKVIITEPRYTNYGKIGTVIDGCINQGELSLFGIKINEKLYYFRRSKFRLLKERKYFKE